MGRGRSDFALRLKVANSLAHVVQTLGSLSTETADSALPAWMRGPRQQGMAAWNAFFALAGGRAEGQPRTMAYECILRTEEAVDAKALYGEFAQVCARDLASAHGGQTVWSGVRVFDQLGANRIAEFPLLSAMLDTLGRENIVMVNYYNMAPNSVQHEHRDQSGNLLFGISRIHIALETNPGAALRIEGRDYHLPAGEVWAIDTSGRHAAVNLGAEDRVHLVIDVKRAPATAGYFPKMTAAVYLHLARFIAIMGWKLLRDIATRPASVLDRLRYIARMAVRRSHVATSYSTPNWNVTRDRLRSHIR